MKTTVVTIHEAKAKLSELQRKAADGEHGIVARGSKPVPKLVPIGKIEGKLVPWSRQGRLVVGHEFFEPLPTDELAARELCFMRVLLETHALLWWVSADPALSPWAVCYRKWDNEVRVSAASAWYSATARSGWGSCPVRWNSQATLTGCYLHKRTPKNLTLIRNETFFDRYGVRRAWC